jgi:hypothetical protein
MVGGTPSKVVVVVGHTQPSLEAKCLLLCAGIRSSTEEQRPDSAGGNEDDTTVVEPEQNNGEWCETASQFQA